LKPVFKDAYAVFAVTNYWESKDADLEMKQGKAMADAAKVGTKSSFIKYILNTQFRKLAFSIMSGAVFLTLTNVSPSLFCAYAVLIFTSVWRSSFQSLPF